MKSENEIANKLADKCADDVESVCILNHTDREHLRKLILSTTALVALVEVAVQAIESTKDDNGFELSLSLEKLNTELTRILGKEFKGL